jgi:glutaredoxin
MGLKSLYYLKSSSLLTNTKVIPALIVTKDDCPWCKKLKEALASDGVQYREITKSEAEEKGYWDSSWKTVPQVWLYKKHIGGYLEYAQLKQKTSEPAYADCLSCEA